MEQEAIVILLLFIFIQYVFDTNDYFSHSKDVESEAEIPEWEQPRHTESILQIWQRKPGSAWLQSPLLDVHI